MAKFLSVALLAAGAAGVAKIIKDKGADPKKLVTDAVQTVKYNNVISGKFIYNSTKLKLIDLVQLLTKYIFKQHIIKSATLLHAIFGRYVLISEFA